MFIALCAFVEVCPAKALTSDRISIGTFETNPLQQSSFSSSSRLHALIHYARSILLSLALAQQFHVQTNGPHEQVHVSEPLACHFGRQGPAAAHRFHDTVPVSH
jgi:hypothetical protein